MDVSTLVRYKIKRLIKEKKITMYQLAQYSDIPYSTLKSIIYSQSNSTSIDNIYRICNGLDITLEEFFSTEEFKAPHTINEEIQEEKKVWLRALLKKR